MKGASTASSTSGSRGECPYCFVPLVRIQSKQDATKDQWFLKCPYNVKGDRTTCPFICSEVQFEVTQARGRQLQMHDAGYVSPMSREAYAGFKEQLNEVRQIVDSLAVDIMALKVQLGEPKVRDVEPKQELDTKIFQIMIDSAALVPLFVGFVGVVIGVILVVLWK